VVDSAALHATFRRHPKLLIEKLRLQPAESAATAPGWRKKRATKSRYSPSGSGLFVVETFQQPRLIPKHLTDQQVPQWESSAKCRFLVVAYEEARRLSRLEAGLKLD